MRVHAMSPAAEMFSVSRKDPPPDSSGHFISSHAAHLFETHSTTQNNFAKFSGLASSCVQGSQAQKLGVRQEPRDTTRLSYVACRWLHLLRSNPDEMTFQIL